MTAPTIAFPFDLPIGRTAAGEAIYPDQDFVAALLRLLGRTGGSAEDFIADALEAAESAQSTADGKITSVWQDAAPDVGDYSEGDLWFDTNDGNKCYQLRSAAWVDAQDSAIGTAISAAAGAQATADTKIVTFYQTSAPTAGEVGDLWHDTDDALRRTYRWNGSAWQNIADQTPYNTAAAITGQGTLATQSTVAWTSEITSRPTELTDGRIPAGLDSSGDLVRNITTTRRNASDLLGFAGGATFTGELAADVTATHTAASITSQGALATLSAAAWGSQVSGRPTELTDGRVSAGLDASGDLARNLTTARANSSNVLRYTSGGLFTGELAADVTLTHTAAAITGQGALATLGGVAEAQIFAGIGANVTPPPTAVGMLGWELLYNDTTFTPKPSVSGVGGEQALKWAITGTPASAKEFRPGQTFKDGLPVIAGQRYEFQAEIKGVSISVLYLAIWWYDSSGTFISETGTGSSGTITSFTRCSTFATAPANAVIGRFVIRSNTNGSANPELHIRRYMLRPATSGQTVVSPWTGETILGAPVNIGSGNAATISPSFPLSSSATSSIAVASATVTFPNGVTYALPSATISSLSTGTVYSVFYDLEALAYVAVSSSATSYLTNPSRYIYVGIQSTQTGGGGYTSPPASPPGGGGWDSGVLP